MEQDPLPHESLKIDKDTFIAIGMAYGFELDDILQLSDWDDFTKDSTETYWIYMQDLKKAKRWTKRHYDTYATLCYQVKGTEHIISKSKDIVIFNDNNKSPPRAVIFDGEDSLEPVMECKDIVEGNNFLIMQDKSKIRLELLDSNARSIRYWCKLKGRLQEMSQYMSMMRAFCVKGEGVKGDRCNNITVFIIANTDWVKEFYVNEGEWHSFADRMLPVKDNLMLGFSSPDTTHELIVQGVLYLKDSSYRVITFPWQNYGFRKRPSKRQ